MIIFMQMIVNYRICIMLKDKRELTYTWNIILFLYIPMAGNHLNFKHASLIKKTFIGNKTMISMK